MAKAHQPLDVDGYISQFPADIQVILQKVRATISHAAPDAKEVISYQFPLDKPIPCDLIEQIVKHRVKQDKDKAVAKRKK